MPFPRLTTTLSFCNTNLFGTSQPITRDPNCDTGCEREKVDLGMMQCAVYAVLSVCRTRCMLYSVSTLGHGMESDDLASCS